MLYLYYVRKCQTVELYIERIDLAFVSFDKSVGFAVENVYKMCIVIVYHI